MGSQWVDDPSWANIFGNIQSQFSGSTGKALENIHAAEVIKDQRIKRQREQQLYDMGINLGGKLDAAIPEASVAPSTMDVVGPYTGDAASEPGVTAGLPTVPVQFIDPRALAAAKARRELAITGGKATVLKDPSQWAPQLGYGTVAATGVPKTAEGRAEIEYDTTGKFPTHIGRDESKMPMKNWVPIDANNQPNGPAVSSPTQPGSNYVLSSPVSAAPPNPYESEAVANNGLAKIQAESAARGHMTEDEVKLATRLLDVAYPWTRVTENEGGRLVEKEVRAKPIPESLKQLEQLTYDYAQGKHLQPPSVPGAQPPPVVTLENQPATPTAPPVVTTPRDPNASRIIRTGPANPAELRKEYMNVQAVSDWMITAPLYNSAIKSAQKPNNQGDINIMYAFAKLMDPGSVVRDQEGKLVMRSGTLDESIVGTFNSLVRGTGTMTPEVRLKLIDTLKNRLDEIKGAKDIADKFYREHVVPEAGLKPEQVIIPAVEPLTYSPEQILGGGGGGAPGAGGGRQQPQQSTNPRVDDILNR